MLFDPDKVTKKLSEVQPMDKKLMEPFFTVSSARVVDTYLDDDGGAESIEYVIGFEEHTCYRCKSFDKIDSDYQGKFFTSMNFKQEISEYISKQLEKILGK